MKTSPGSSSTFTRPPLDGSLTYPEIFDYNAQHSPDHPVFQFYDQDHIQKVTWSEVAKAIHAAGRIVLENVPRTDIVPVVGVLAHAGMFTFHLIGRWLTWGIFSLQTASHFSPS